MAESIHGEGGQGPIKTGGEVGDKTSEEQKIARLIDLVKNAKQYLSEAYDAKDSHRCIELRNEMSSLYREVDLPCYKNNIGDPTMIMPGGESVIVNDEDFDRDGITDPPLFFIEGKEKVIQTLSHDREGLIDDIQRSEDYIKVIDKMLSEIDPLKDS